MSTRIIGAGLPLLATALFAVGCGSDDKSSENEGGGGEETTRSACTGGTAVKDTGLPPAFPQPGELTITKVQKDGPTIVLDGYWKSELPEAYREWKENFEANGYKVLFNELEEHDSEVSYSGSGRTGQVALRDNCTEDNVVRVHITNRPA
jgi:hypothetical protein